MRKKIKENQFLSENNGITTGRHGLRAVSCRTDIKPERKDKHREPLKPYLTGSGSYGFGFHFLLLCF